MKKPYAGANRRTCDADRRGKNPQKPIYPPQKGWQPGRVPFFEREEPFTGVKPVVKNGRFGKKDRRETK